MKELLIGEYMYSFLMTLVLANVITVLLLKIPLYSPFAINAVCWFVSLYIGMFFGEGYYPLSYNSVSYLCAWIISFGLISFPFSFIRNRRVNKYFFIISLSGRIYLFFLMSTFVCVLELCREIYVVGMVGEYNNFFLNLRIAAIESDKVNYALWLSTSIYPVMLALFCVFCVSEKIDIRTKSIFYLLLFWNVLYSLATMSKFWFMSLVIIVISTYLYKGRFKVGKILLLMSALIGTMYGFNLLRAGENGSVHTDIMYQILLYLYSPVVALNYVESTVIHSSFFGEYVFSFFYNVAKTFGFIDGDKVSGILSYVYVPVETNIYTALQPFIADFGFSGVIVGAVFYAMIYSIFYYSFSFSGWVFPCYVTIIYSLALQFITETLLMNFSGNIKAILAVIFIYFLMKRYGYIHKVVD
ncbi:oligosaccharide repeat unit polymerase [Aeromonas veronii]|uniref:oligosaccharide repeat unit polymerase n=2 Tax=Aeromonas veronii TaxID=654 RepID=UPI00191DB591|nr:oligosaccharide repeat unit polymerase [Aeromonas veronii]